MANYLDSSKIKVFPTAFRDHSIDPASFLNTELNLTNLRTISTQHKSFVAFGDPTIICLGGYCFYVYWMDIEQLLFENGWFQMWAYIKLLDDTITLPQDVVMPNLRLDNIEATGTCLDNADSGLFQGLKFVGTEPTSGYTYKIKVMEFDDFTLSYVVPKKSLLKLTSSEVSNGISNKSIEESFETESLRINNGDDGVTINEILKSNTLDYDYDRKLATFGFIEEFVNDEINDLDVSDLVGDSSGSMAGKTLLTLNETDGKIGATFQDIQITESQVTNLTTDLANKVDKVDGKGLSTNDYGNVAKAKVDGLANTTSQTANRVLLSDASDYSTKWTTGSLDTTSEKPLYLDSSGVLTAGDVYAGGTKVTLNGTSKASNTASFYAPTIAITTSTNKMYLVGSKSTTSVDEEHTNSNVYMQSGKLYSNGKEVVTLTDTQTITNKTLTNSIIIGGTSVFDSITFVDGETYQGNLSNAGGNLVWGSNYVVSSITKAPNTQNKVLVSTTSTGEPDWTSGNLNSSDIKPLYLSSSGVLTAGKTYAGGTSVTVNNEDYSSASLGLNMDMGDYSDTHTKLSPISGDKICYYINASGAVPSSNATLKDIITNHYSTYCTDFYYLITFKSSANSHKNKIWTLMIKADDIPANHFNTNTETFQGNDYLEFSSLGSIPVSGILYSSTSLPKGTNLPELVQGRFIVFVTTNDYLRMRIDVIPDYKSYVVV